MNSILLLLIKNEAYQENIDASVIKFTSNNILVNFEFFFLFVIQRYKSAFSQDYDKVNILLNGETSRKCTLVQWSCSLKKKQKSQ